MEREPTAGTGAGSAGAPRPGGGISARPVLRQGRRGRRRGYDHRGHPPPISGSLWDGGGDPDRDRGDRDPVVLFLPAGSGGGGFMEIGESLFDVLVPDQMTMAALIIRFILITAIAVVLLLILGWEIKQIVPPEDLAALINSCGEDCIFV